MARRFTRRILGDEMADAPPVLRAGREPLSGELLAARHVPKPELGGELPVAAARDAPDHQCLGADLAPVRKPRQGVDVADIVQERRRIERLEQARPLEVGGQHLGHLLRELGIVAREDRDRDRDRRHDAVALRAAQPFRAEAVLAAPLVGALLLGTSPSAHPRRLGRRHVIALLAKLILEPSASAAPADRRRAIGIVDLRRDRRRAE